MRCANCRHKVKRYHGKWYHSHGHLVHNLTIKCSNCDCRTPYIPVEHIAIKPSMEWFVTILNKIKYKLNKKPYYNRFSSNKFFNNLVWMIILSLTFFVIYYNIDKINLSIKGFPLGNILLLINGIFLIKYSYQILKGIFYLYGDQRKWIKCLVVLMILSLAWHSYLQKETILSPLIDLTNQNPKNTELKFNIEKEVVGWWNENKPKAGFNPETSDIENIVFSKVNEERSKRGLNTLRFDSELSKVARLHSLDMITRNFFGHDNPDGEDPTARAIKSSIVSIKN